MPHIVTSACIGKKYTDCVTVCPVDCFHEDKKMLVIDPDVCIDCGACIKACPVKAIYLDVDVPADQREFISINAEKSKRLPVITKRKDADSF